MTNNRIIQLVTKNLDEVITADDLRVLLEKGVPLKHYIGFEISGFIHIGNGLSSMLKIRDLQQAAVETTVFLADWHTWINRKLGGADLDTIKRVAVRFFKEGMTAAALCVGADPDKIKFVLGSDLYHNNDEYWQTFIEVCKNTTHARMQRSITIAGKREGDSVDFAILIYPAMQVADIFIQGISIAHAGMDQRKAHVIMRDVALAVHSQNNMLRENQLKPIAIHQHILFGLGKPSVWPIPAGADKKEIQMSMKMSKSRPETCVFLHDSPEDIERKVTQAFCPEGEIEFNPVIDWIKHLVFPIEEKFFVERSEKFGGSKEYHTFESLEKDFRNKELHPQDLKKAAARSFINILEPARKYLSHPDRQQMMKEMGQLTRK